MNREQPLLNALLAATHLVVPDDVPALVQTFAERLHADTGTLYLADSEQRQLVPLPPPGGPDVEAVTITGTLAGRCFRSVTPVEMEGDGSTTVWMPVVDGTERLGVLQLVFAGKPADEDEMKAFAGLLAEIVMTKSAYGDFFELARRREPFTIAAELLWQLLPPLTFATHDLAIAASFVPTACLGGDAFDYGVDATTAEIAIFDALGHDLDAGLLATTAVAGFRNGRRNGFSLERKAQHIGDAIAEHFDVSKFVTGILTDLDIASGRFSWCVAGHPAPLLLRGGRVVKHLDRGIGQPFGVGPASEVFTEQLERGDRVLLYTDGVTEARDEAGQFFQLEKLVDLVSRTSEHDPPPETMRLLMHAIEEHNDGPMRDDATVVLIEWRGDAGRQLEV